MHDTLSGIFRRGSKMPAYVVIAAAVDHWSRGMDPRPAVRVLARVGAALLILLPLKFSVQRVALWQAVPERYTIPARFLAVVPRTVVVECPWPIELMFHPPVVAAYDHALPVDVEERLRVEGYTIIRYGSN